MKWWIWVWLAIRGKSRWKKKWKIEEMAIESKSRWVKKMRWKNDENLKSWQLEVSPDMWIGELAVKDKSRPRR